MSVYNIFMNRKEYKHQWYLKNRERLIQKSCERYSKNKIHYDKYHKEWILKNRERNRIIQKKYHMAHLLEKRERQRKYMKKPLAKIRQHARAAIQYAIRKGILVRPSNCQECNSSSTRIEAHHYLGYSKSNILKVQWLCTLCHAQFG